MILIYNVYGTIDNKNVRRNRIGQNLVDVSSNLVHKLGLNYLLQSQPSRQLEKIMRGKRTLVR